MYTSLVAAGITAFSAKTKKLLHRLKNTKCQTGKLQGCVFHAKYTHTIHVHVAILSSRAPAFGADRIDASHPGVSGPDKTKGGVELAMSAQCTLPKKGCRLISPTPFRWPNRSVGSCSFGLDWIRLLIVDYFCCG